MGSLPASLTLQFLNLSVDRLEFLDDSDLSVKAISLKTKGNLKKLFNNYNRAKEDICY